MGWKERGERRMRARPGSSNSVAGKLLLCEKFSAQDISARAGQSLPFIISTWRKRQPENPGDPDPCRAEQQPQLLLLPEVEILWVCSCKLPWRLGITSSVLFSKLNSSEKAFLCQQFCQMLFFPVAPREQGEEYGIGTCGKSKGLGTGYL